MIPFIEKRLNGGHRLVVDNEDFLILGLQWACNSCFDEETMGPLFEQAKKIGANTAVLPVYWSQLEPQPGKFDFSILDYEISMCRKYDLKLIPLWFASYKNAECCYAPHDIRTDPSYRKVIRKDGSVQSACLCPTGEDALKRDITAIRELALHLKEIDAEQNTVIMLQIENEPGIMGTDRCHCSVCDTLFDGSESPEMFTARCIARYVNTVAGAAKEVYPLPTYANVWLSASVADVPGFSYPAGGAVKNMLDIWLSESNNLDMIAPDIYQHSYLSFKAICEHYARENNPLYIAETSSGLSGRVDKNAFYAIGCHGAIGFDPWSIDIPFPDQSDAPLVHPLDGTWGPQAYALRDSYKSIADAMLAITDAVGTDRIAVFVQEDGESGTSFMLGGVAFCVNYEGGTRGMVIHLGENQFIALGKGYRIQPRKPSPDGRALPVEELHRGRFESSKWLDLHPVVRETANGDHGFAMRKAGAVRFKVK